jgi:hypothetical protein
MCYYSYSLQRVLIYYTAVAGIRHMFYIVQRQLCIRFITNIACDTTRSAMINTIYGQGHWFLVIFTVRIRKSCQPRNVPVQLILLLIWHLLCRRFRIYFDINITRNQWPWPYIVLIIADLHTVIGQRPYCIMCYYSYSLQRVHEQISLINFHS